MESEDLRQIAAICHDIAADAERRPGLYELNGRAIAHLYACVGKLADALIATRNEP